MTKPTLELTDKLDTYFHELTCILDDFLSCLKAEQKDLEANQDTNLDKSTESKNLFLDQINKKNKKLTKLFKDFKLEFNKQGITSLLAKLPIADKLILDQKWQDILAKLAKCEEQNQINGFMIYGLYNNNQKLLNMIFNSSKVKTYNESGKIE